MLTAGTDHAKPTVATSNRKSNSVAFCQETSQLKSKEKDGCTQKSKKTKS